NQRKIEALAFSHERQAAFDAELKNEQQRKSRKQQLLETDSQYQKLKEYLGKIKLRRAQLEIDLERARNEFSIKKLFLKKR
ncbi:MAG: hypothetical protein HC908_16805, partial [Calothrix sp. SM1_7_51]|nr:hypothetical protein [Calothrix sp. SM1_7_51]